MITVLIRTKNPGRSRTVHGVVYLDYDPVRMDVVSRYPKPGKPAELLEERVPLMAVVRNFKRLYGLPPREVLEKLRHGEHLRLETDPIRGPGGAGRSP